LTALRAQAKRKDATTIQSTRHLHSYRSQRLQTYISFLTYH
jgi:hypothetical protein